MNKKQKLYQEIAEHGEALKKFFKINPSQDPILLCKKLFSVENQLRRLFTDHCNVGVPDEQLDRAEETALKILMVNHIDTKQIFINRDPRGSALKIKNSEELRNSGVFRDFGGDGVLVPDFRY